MPLKNDTYPILLVKNDLLKPINRTRQKLVEITNNAPKDNELFLEGLFCLAVSGTETMLIHALKIFLRNIPKQILEKKITIEKHLLLENRVNIPDSYIEQYVRDLSYTSQENILAKISEKMRIDLSTFINKNGDSLKEIKESRNLLIHNDLTVNSTYRTKAGPRKRSNEIGEKMEIDFQYFTDSLEILINLCDCCIQSIELEYKDHSKTRAIENLWNYIFKSPVLKFRDIWEIEEDSDTVQLKNPDFYPTASSSEKVFIRLWLSHYNSSLGGDISETPYALEDLNKEKFIWLTSVLAYFNPY